jgi:hypothetical protein
VPDEPALAERLDARTLAPGVLRVERRYPLTRRHGRIVLGACVPELPSLARDCGPPSGWLFLDTETSGLAGGTGTWAFLCGLARIEGDDLLVRQYLLARLDAEPAYLDAVGGEIRSAGLLVTYNGKTFDVPLLATRFRLAGMRSPLGPMAHLDLLGLVRRAFAPVWPDCRLATAEARLLGVGREGDLPGSEAPSAWLSWLRQGQVDALAGVLEHNRRDLLSLPALVPALAQSLRDPAATGADIGSVAAHHLRVGDRERAFGLLSANRGRLCARGLLDLAGLCRRRGAWDEALAIWEMLAQRDEPRAVEALAKHLEHRAGDLHRALQLAARLPRGAAREHRLRRLQRRVNGACGEN